MGSQIMEDQKVNISEEYISDDYLEKEKEREERREKRHERKGCGTLGFAVFFTIVLAIFDFLSVREVFTRSSLSPLNATTFAILFALGLEGIPFFTASFVAKALLEYKVKKNDKLYAWIGVILGMIGLIIAWIVAMYIRYVLIEKSGGRVQYYDENTNPNLGEYKNYTADIFLMWSPIITSILAFLASWWSTAWDIENKIKKEVDFYHKKFLYKESLYRMEVEKLLNLRAVTWNAVTEYEAERIPIPSNEQVFREEVTKRIRRQLILNSIALYPGEIERFQNKIEAELGSYLSQLAINSTNPELLLSIDLKALIQRYDEEQLQKGKLEMCWDYSKAGKALEDELKSCVDNRKPQIHSTFGLGGN